MVLLAKMEGTNAERAYQGFTKKLRHVLAPLHKTLTYDRGKEMAAHEQLAQRLALGIFFADPHSPWQHGTNENTTGWLRQYLPMARICRGTRNARSTPLRSASAKYAPTKVPQLCHAPGSLRALAPSFTRCTWNLNPP